MSTQLEKDPYLYEHQFELSGVIFGLGRPVTVEDEGFDPGSITWRDQDSQMPGDDATVFGREYLTTTPWTWNLSTDGCSTEDALAYSAELQRAWAAPEIRRTPGAVLPLRYKIGNRTRRIYGRPRRYVSPYSNRILNGYIPITVDFARSDGIHYDDIEQRSNVGLIAAVAGGFSVPFRSPLTTLRYLGPRAGNIVVGGDTPTWPIITFTGPVQQPWIEVAGWRLEVQTTIAYDATIVVDTRPWARSVLLNGTTFLPGILARRTRLEEMSLPPGPHEILFGGIDTTGSATVTVSWRDAYSTI